MINAAGGDSKWRASKLVNAISRAKCELSLINEFIEKALNQNKDTCLIARTMYNLGTPSSLIDDNIICVNNYVFGLKDNNEVLNPVHPLYVKQGTDFWFQLRKQAVFTGSTLYRGLGLAKFKEQINFLKEKLENNDSTDLEKMGNSVAVAANAVQSVAPNKYLEWGLANEKHAVSTLVSFVIPLYYPGMTFVEVGASFISCEYTHETLVEVSADGLICAVDFSSGLVGDVVAKVEIKCPYPEPANTYKMPVYYNIPKYYALQLIAEMEAEPSVKELLFTCYSPASTVISRVTFDSDLWLSAKLEIKNLLHMMKSGKLPKQRTLFAKDILPAKIDEFLNKCVDILTEVPSVKDNEKEADKWLTFPYSSPFNVPQLPNDNLFPVNGERMVKLGDFFNAVIHAGYEISRIKAKELFVCLLSPATRQYDAEKPACFPIFYGLKGKVFSQSEKRNLYDTVMNACHEKKIDILATSFDGECFSLITEDAEGKPLTLIQLQHEVFEKARKLSKQEIIRNIVSKARNAISQDETEGNRITYIKTGKIILKGLPFPKNPFKELHAAIAEHDKAHRRSDDVSASNVEGKRKTKMSQTKENSKKKDKKKKKICQPNSLAQMSRKVVESATYYKSALNVSYSNIIWQEELRQWKENSPINHGIDGFPEVWYCIPEFNQGRQRLEHKVWDATHLMTNMRRVVCSKGTKYLRKEAWVSAAHDPSTKLKPSMVLDLPDKQDISFALTTFSFDVENAMEKAGFYEEAKFCKLMREWWAAEDEPGIAAVQRVKQRNELRNYLLNDVDFGTFPPYSCYVKGFPRKLYEGFLASIDSKNQLYGLTLKSYNTRSVSTLMSENFFSSLIELDTSGTGYLRAEDVPRCMGTACAMVDIRLNPNKVFDCKTTKGTVYKVHDVENTAKEIDRASCNKSNERPQKITSIMIRDDFFDTEDRARTKGKRKAGTLSEFGAPPRKAQPVRAYHRCDESKILPEKLFSCNAINQ